MKRKASVMGVIALGALLTAISLTTTDNTTQTGESMTVAENESNKLTTKATPIAGVALVQYDILNGMVMPDIVLASNDVALTKTAYVEDENVETEDDVEATEVVEETEEVQEETQDVDNQESNEEEETGIGDDKENETAEEQKSDVDENDLYVLSHVIYAEAGSEKCSDETRYYVGSVVLNRVKSKYFKQDTIEGIVFAKGQYSCTWIGTYYNEPSERCVEIARDLLENGSVLPENVVFQAEFKQGDGVYAYMDNTYFCYKD